MLGTGTKGSRTRTPDGVESKGSVASGERREAGRRARARPGATGGRAEHEGRGEGRGDRGVRGRRRHDRGEGHDRPKLRDQATDAAGVGLVAGVAVGRREPRSEGALRGVIVDDAPSFMGEAVDRGSRRLDHEGRDAETGGDGEPGAKTMAGGTHGISGSRWGAVYEWRARLTRRPEAAPPCASQRPTPPCPAMAPRALACGTTAARTFRALRVLGAPSALGARGLGTWTLLLGLAISLQGATVLAHGPAEIVDNPATLGDLEAPRDASDEPTEPHDPETCSLCLALGTTNPLLPPPAAPTPGPASALHPLAPASERPGSTQAFTGSGGPRAPPLSS